MIRGEMNQITNDVQLLNTKQLNDAKLVNKGMLSEVETGVKREIHKNIDATTTRIDILSERMEVQVKATDTTVETLAALLEQVTALNKNISSVQGDVNRWKEQE